VKLFRSLFRGAKRSPDAICKQETGNAGYAPACSNKRESGLCALKTGANKRRLAQKLFVEKQASVPLINQSGGSRPFQNPEFYKKQSMRLRRRRLRA